MRIPSNSTGKAFVSKRQLRRLTPRQEASSADTSAERLIELAQDPKLARLVAGNPNAPADLLLELSHSDDKAVRKACSSNAGTPVETLLKLGSQFPEQLLDNPVFNLLLLANPGPFDDLPIATLNSLLKRDRVPVELIRWAWKHRGKTTLHSLLMNPNTPSDVVKELCKSKDPATQMAASLHCSKKLPIWASKINDALTLERHIAHNSINCYHLSSKCIAIIENLLRLGFRELAIDLTGVATSYQRCEIAQRQEASAELLKLLAKGSSADVRRKVAKNHRTPAEVLLQLVEDTAPAVRWVAAENQNMPAEMLRQLANHEDAAIRLAVSRNILTVAEALISGGIWRKSPAEWLRYEATCDQLCALAQYQNTPTQILEILAKNDNPGIRWKVALNCSAPTVILNGLAMDQVKKVRRAAEASIQTAAIPSSPQAASDSFLVEICANECKHSQPSPSRRFLLTLPQCPASILVKNFRSSSWQDRFAIACNPSTPKAVLERMANEGNQLVRRAARSNLNHRAARADRPSAQPINP